MTVIIVHHSAIIPSVHKHMQPCVLLGFKAVTQSLGCMRSAHNIGHFVLYRISFHAIRPCLPYKILTAETVILFYMLELISDLTFFCLCLSGSIACYAFPGRQSEQANWIWMQLAFGCICLFHFHLLAIKAVFCRRLGGEAELK